MPKTRSTRHPHSRYQSPPQTPSAITAAFLECSTFLRKFLAGFLRSRQDIEDVAQETYLRAWIAEPRETIEQPKAFLFHVAKNLALTRLPQKSRQITDYIEEAGATEVIETAAGTDQDLEAQQCLDLYCAAVATLPEKCRQVFLYRKVHGLSHKDIGERMRRERPIAQLMINALALSRRTDLRLYDFTCA